MTAKHNISQPLTYADAGVSIEAGNSLVQRIAPLAAATARVGTMDGLGGFGGLFDLKACGYTDPILVSATDGVGTKLKLAFMANRHQTVGIDLVAMSVNDLVVQGAEPLFFLDYFACGALDVAVAEQVIAGVAQGCTSAGCQLIGGETAEMPGMYPAGEYDLAGFAVGVVERSGLLPNRAAMQSGDVVLGLASSGVHSNGYSLVRKIIEAQHIDLHGKSAFDPQKTLASALLEPTRIYVKSLLPQVRQGRIKALAHITGGGLSENIPRIMPAHLTCQIRMETITLPPLFAWLQQVGNVSDSEMLRTFNCGIGMVAVVAAAQADDVMQALRDAGETVQPIGTIEASQGQPITFKGNWA